MTEKDLMGKGREPVPGAPKGRKRALGGDGIEADFSSVTVRKSSDSSEQTEEKAGCVTKW